MSTRILNSANSCSYTFWLRPFALSHNKTLSGVHPNDVCSNVVSEIIAG